jgi:hypothetical protein
MLEYLNQKAYEKLKPRFELVKQEKQVNFCEETT